MTKANIVFLHPDLGIGGAERLVVDAALALKQRGYNVNFVTTHHDTSHCFTETRDGTLPVTTVGDWIPRNLFGRFYALFMYLRMIYAAVYLVLFSELKPDLVFCDIVSACIPVLRLFKKQTLFYCHFPDQLLSHHEGFFKTLYRAPLDWFEEKSTSCADRILVNSEFTKKVFKDTFKSLKQVPDVLYPSTNTDFFDKTQAQNSIDDILDRPLPQKCFLFLSINRYERKKNVSLAIHALSTLKTLLTEEDWDKVRLIIAGGYDNRVAENIYYYDELTTLAAELDVSDKVYFLKSPSDAVKLSLLRNCKCLVYTPHNEHFGIVPLEAMYCEKPVIAVNSGGPTETVEHEKTGFLCEMTKESFADAMVKLMKDESLGTVLGKCGKKRFTEKFSFQAFSDQLNSVVESMLKRKDD